MGLPDDSGELPESDGEDEDEVSHSQQFSGVQDASEDNHNADSHFGASYEPSDEVVQEVQDEEDSEEEDH